MLSGYIYELGIILDRFFKLVLGPLYVHGLTAGKDIFKREELKNI